jgi:tRNA G37 N-methylase TrmD
MKYITDEDFTKIDEDCYQHPMIIHEEQVPEELIHVSMQQITHEGRTYQLQRRRKTRREQEDEYENQRKKILDEL